MHVIRTPIFNTMSQRQTLAILFYLRRDKKKRSKVVPIYMRITVNGQRSELATQRAIHPDRWNKAGGQCRGSKADITQLNEYLNKMRSKVYTAQQDLKDANKPITAISLRNRVQGVGENKHTLMDLFESHNKDMEKLVPAEYAPATMKRYDITLQHVRNFIKYQYGVEDIYLSQLNHEFVSSLDHYFKVVRKCNHNTSSKYIKNLKKVVNLAIKNEWLIRDPFIKFSAKIKPVKREYLTGEELKRVEELSIGFRRLDQVRDIFVFSCYTGLAYIDVTSLTTNNLVKGIEGKLWIKTARQKTETKSNIPLLTPALNIIEKYKEAPDTSVSGTLLPVLSNQKMNAYLKEIATLASIEKDLTFHIARHTFATTVTLANGVPIESVSEMLGHKSIRTTQIYAKVIDAKVSQDMTALENVISKKTKQSKTG